MFRTPPSSSTQSLNTPTRPTSDVASPSRFADSAISMDTPTPSPKRSTSAVSIRPEETTSRPLFERLTQLASLAWAAEQDERVDKMAQRMIQKQLDDIEARLEGEEADDETTRDEVVVEPQPADHPTQGEPTTAELRHVLSHLTSTVSSMRQRRQEQAHLHKVSMSKLEAVAQQCLLQERAMQQLNNEVRNLRDENRELGGENDVLRRRLEDLESQATQKAVAVDAMAGAVAGLEGWINTPRRDMMENDTSTTTKQTPRRVIVRGRGRFRGRYYVDDPAEDGVQLGLDGVSDARDLQEGVKAWLRGFRDVEEGLRVGSRCNIGGSKDFLDTTSLDEDFGDFESVP